MLLYSEVATVAGPYSDFAPTITKKKHIKSAIETAPGLQSKHAAFHKAMAGEVQAKFDAARVKACGPVKLALRKKIVPLHAETRAAKISKQRLPAAHVPPRAGFSEGRGGVNLLCFNAGVEPGRFQRRNSRLGIIFWQGVSSRMLRNWPTIKRKSPITKTGCRQDFHFSAAISPALWLSYGKAT